MLQELAEPRIKPLRPFPGREADTRPAGAPDRIATETAAQGTPGRIVTVNPLLLFSLDDLQKEGTDETKRGGCGARSPY